MEKKLKDIFNGRKRLNLGCESEYKEGWVNVDFDKRYKADVYCDLNKFPYPFKDNEFDGILASAILEHLDDVYKVMMELYRISKNNGLIYILVPHTSDPFRHVEFEHKHFFSILSFGEPWVNKELYPYFKVIKRKISFTRINFKFMNFLNPLINLFPRVYERLFSYWLPSSVVVFILRVKKDEEFHKRQLERIKLMEKKLSIDNLRFIKEI